jgi:hypothetical protein
VRKKTAALRREYGGPSRAAALAVQFDAKLRFERDKAIADALLGDAKRLCGGANLPDAGQFDERGDLIGAEMRQSRHRDTIQRFRL